MLPPTPSGRRLCAALVLAAPTAAAPAFAEEPPPPRVPPAVLVTPYLTVASTTRNLTLGARLSVGRPVGPGFSLSLGGDWLLSGLIAGFLLDDIGSPRLTSSQLFTWTWAWPHSEGSPPENRRWLPRFSLGLGVWETAEFDSLLQTARTEDFGLLFADSVGAQAALLFPYVSVAFAVRPMGSTVYLRGEDTFPTEFQFTNAVLDVDVTLDLAQLWRAGRHPGGTP